jgi:hypothetical protein
LGSSVLDCSLWRIASRSTGSSIGSAGVSGKEIYIVFRLSHILSGSLWFSTEFHQFSTSSERLSGYRIHSAIREYLLVAAWWDRSGSDKSGWSVNALSDLIFRSSQRAL